jgi:hypothetical protein
MSETDGAKAEKLRNKTTAEINEQINLGEGGGVAEPIYNMGRSPSRAKNSSRAKNKFQNCANEPSTSKGKITDFATSDAVDSRNFDINSHGENSRKSSVQLDGTQNPSNSQEQPRDGQKRKFAEPIISAKWFQEKVFIKVEYAGNIWTRQVEIEPDIPSVSDAAKNGNLAENSGGEKNGKKSE